MKQRHIKTFEEKYGVRSVYSECMDVIHANRKNVNPEEVFEKLPYLGYLYVPVARRYRDWWYDTNKFIGNEEFKDSHIKSKVVEVSHRGHIKIAQIDDHHSNLMVLDNPRLESISYRVKGNVLIHLDDIKGDNDNG